MAAPAVRSGSTEHQRWEQVGTGPGSWYLDPIVARQKRRLNAALLAALPKTARLGLKTDSYEEAFGEDSPIEDLLPYARHWLVIDRAYATLHRAQKRLAGKAVSFLNCDVRRIGLAPGSLDLIFSNSTLDHFTRREDFVASLAQLAGATRPGGHLVLTVDNPLNPLYWPLRWLCAFQWSPFPLGYTVTPRQLRDDLQAAGFQVQSSFYLVHNPRVLSTALFLTLRRILGPAADRPIRGLLAAFQSLNRLPTRPITACFHGVVAIRQGSRA